MRGKAIGIFFAGFAAGVLFLTVLLWQTGKLTAGKTSPTPQPHPAGDADRRPEPVPVQPAVQPPAPWPNIAEPAQPAELGGEKLLIPVQGVAATTLTDDFNQARGGHRHEAIDILAPHGTPVLAAAEGNVVKLFTSEQGGLTVYQFDDSRTYCFYYAHLDRYAAGLKEGTLLRKGDVLGYVGTTGDAPPDTPHLHFAISKLGPEKHWWEGTALDPYPFLIGQPGLLR
jgi:murein DD-endopeptidase MepM/ murein hydrolase activator NlpD